jgi:hypothetical protein
MSLFDWFAPRKKPQAPPTEVPSSGLSRLDSTRPVHAAGREHAAAQPANRKQERMARRELLYLVVREAMVRAGVLTSSYKFKVLSLDARGRQFLVMVDLAQRGRNDMGKLAEIEALIAQSAKYRYDILVTAVYWRSNEHVALGEVGKPARGADSAPAPLASELVVEDSDRAPITEPATLPDGLRTRPAAIDPLHPSEVEAFRRALSASARGEQALASVPAPRRHEHAEAHSYTLLTGFEDTEMAAEEGPDLSGTQYGELR